MIHVHECETFPFILTELLLSERTFGTNSEALSDDCRTLHTAELHSLYFSPDLIENELKSAEFVARRLGENCIKCFGRIT